MASLVFARCLFLLASMVSAVAVDTQQRFVRREGEGAIELSPTGNLVQTVTDSPTATVVTATGETAADNKQAAPDMSEPSEYPKFDFPQGISMSNDCATPTDKEDSELTHHKITHPDLCKYAATESGAKVPNKLRATETYDNSDFLVLEDEDQKMHPVGCFADACGPATDKLCYYYNPYAGSTTEASPTFGAKYKVTNGTPICMRHKFVKGNKGKSVMNAADYNAPANSATLPKSLGGAVNGGCPADYEPIMDQDYCKAKGNLLGFSPGEPFRTGGRTFLHQPAEVDLKLAMDGLTCKEDDASWKNGDGLTNTDLCLQKAKERHNNYPLGCYIGPKDETGADGSAQNVYFNFVEKNWKCCHCTNAVSFDEPTGNADGKLTGTPLCRVTQTTIVAGLELNVKPTVDENEKTFGDLQEHCTLKEGCSIVDHNILVHDDSTWVQEACKPKAAVAPVTGSR